MTDARRSARSRRAGPLLRRIAALALASAACLTLGATASRAVTTTVTYSGTDYEVTSFLGSYDDNATLLESQVWFGDFDIASTFAGLVNTQLGTPGFGVHSPYFAFETNLLGTEYTHRTWDTRIPGVSGQSQSTSAAWTFATATAVSTVPLPAGALLLLTGLAGVAAVRRRAQRAA